MGNLSNWLVYSLCDHLTVYVSCPSRRHCRNIAGFRDLRNYFGVYNLIITVRNDGQSYKNSSHVVNPLKKVRTLAMSNSLIHHFLPELLYLKSLPAIICPLPLLCFFFFLGVKEGNIFLVPPNHLHPIPNDTTSSALLCLQYFSSFHVILLS